MNSSIINTTGNVLSFVDLILIGCVFVYFNRRIGSIEKTTGISVSGSAYDSKKTVLEDRVISLENDIEVLLQRLHCYDDLFGKIINRLKESDLPPEKFLESTPSRRTSIRSRHNESLLARKEPFVEVCIENDTPVKESYPDIESDDDAMFSFLKD